MRIAGPPANRHSFAAPRNRDIWHGATGTRTNWLQLKRRSNEGTDCAICSAWPRLGDRWVRHKGLGEYADSAHSDEGGSSVDNPTATGRDARSDPQGSGTR